MFVIEIKLRVVGLNILQTKLICFQKCTTVYAYPCFDAWRQYAMIFFDKHFIPHWDRFAHHFGDGGIKSLVVVRM